MKQRRCLIVVAVLSSVLFAMGLAGCLFSKKPVPISILAPHNEWHGSIVIESSTPDLGANTPLSNLIDGDHGSRWVSVGKFPEGLDYHWVKITLPEPMQVSRLVLISDDGYQGASPERIAAEFALDYWDGTDWIEIVHVTGNTEKIVEASFEPIETDQWRLRVIKPGQTDDMTIRLVEMELWTPTEEELVK